MTDTESKWKRSKPSRIYDYNFKVSEGYYKPQTEYIDTRYKGRNEQPPDDTHLSYAERYSARPWYGGTRGLPYDESKAEMNKPLLKPSARPRGSSLVREIQEDEKDNIPLNIRAYRRKKRMEDEEEQLGIRPKPKTLADVGVKKFEPKHNLKEEIQNELRRIDDQMSRAMERTRISSPEVTDVVSKYSQRPVKTSSHHEESYTLPSGAKVKSYEERQSYKYSSTSKPPAAPRSRHFSASDEVSSLAGRHASRMNSLSDEVTPALKRTYRRSSISSVDLEDDELLPVYSNRAAKIREQKRQKESENLTESISKMVDKMRVGNVDPSAVYSYHKSLRASSLEPPRKSKNKAKALNFVYGVGRI